MRELRKKEKLKEKTRDDTEKNNKPSYKTAHGAVEHCCEMPIYWKEDE